jgi:N6-L-threonylcarbamoyladenine synthase
MDPSCGQFFCKINGFSAIPLVSVNHIRPYFSSFYKWRRIWKPSFPLSGFTISGGHTQIVKVNDFWWLLSEKQRTMLSEAFDKSAKILGLPIPWSFSWQTYPIGNPKAFAFTKPKVQVWTLVFQGKTAYILYKRKVRSQFYRRKHQWYLCLNTIYNCWDLNG